MNWLSLAFSSSAKVLWISVRIPSSSPFKLFSSMLHEFIACYRPANIWSVTFLTYLISLVLVDEFVFLSCHCLKLLCEFLGEGLEVAPVLNALL